MSRADRKNIDHILNRIAILEDLGNRMQSKLDNATRILVAHANHMMEIADQKNENEKT